MLSVCRIVDVSTVGELCRRWFPREHMRAPKKKNTHTALSGATPAWCVDADWEW